MKVNVNFTVEFDGDQYRRARAYNSLEKPMSNAEIRREIQNSAMDRITFGLGDEGIACEAIHNN